MSKKLEKTRMKIYKCEICSGFFLKSQLHRHLVKHRHQILQLEKLLERYASITFKEVK